MEEAEGATIAVDMRAAVWKGWRDFPDRRLLTDLSQRTARRREGDGSPDSRRPPSYQEGLRVARPTLADVADTGLFDVEWESAAVSKVLADQWLPPNGVPSRGVLRGYIKRSGSNRASFGALGHIEEKLHDRGESIPRQLARWREEAAGGLRRRPARKPVQSHRPANPDQLKRDMQIQFTIEVLHRVGIKPNGSDVSGCCIVADVLGLSEDTVTRIWKARVGKRPFVPVMQKQMKAMAERAGPFIPPEA